MTRAATSAKEGMVTEVTGPEEVWIGDDCAFDFFISPRSALRTTPNATDAMTIAMVDKIRLVDEFIGVLLLMGSLPLLTLETAGRAVQRSERALRILHPRAVEVPARGTCRRTTCCDELRDEWFRRYGYEPVTEVLKKKKAPLAGGFLR